MDRRTLEYYENAAAGLAGRYNAATGGVADHFRDAFPAGSTVLDMGCGTGRDMHLLMMAGYEPYGIDGSRAMAEEAVNSLPELAGRVRVGSVPYEGLYFGREFDCLLCSAVLMHITDEDIRDAVMTIRRNLREGGTLLLSVPLSRPGLDAEGRDGDGRLFVIRPIEFYTMLLEPVGLHPVASFRDVDCLGRQGIEWVSAVYG